MGEEMIVFDKVIIIIVTLCYVMADNTPIDNTVCSELADGMSGSNNYKSWKIKYTNCVFMEGNIRLTNFLVNNPDEYDFSFLDNITEITGYIYISNTNIRTLRLKNLRIIRGQILVGGHHSVYISNNHNLERLDLPSLTEIQTGSLVIQKNKNLCVNTINWYDVLPNSDLLNKSIIKDNSHDKDCFNCSQECCHESGNLCHCWTENSCQTLTKVICNSRCEGRCYGPDLHDCCHAQCAAGCTGPYRQNCSSCVNFRIKQSGECIEQCPRTVIADPATGQLKQNKNGMYQLMKTCVKECPSTWVIYQDLCLKICPNNTYEVVQTNAITNQTYVECKECTRNMCPKTCAIEDTKYIDKTNFMSFKNCEVLNGRFVIIEPDEEKYDHLSEDDLEVFNNLREITHYVWIQSKKIKTLNFFRNLETIKGRSLLRNTYALALNLANLKTLNLKNFKRVENGKIVIQATSACLIDTIKWDAISSYKAIINHADKDNCTSQGYLCNKMCDGCWSTNADMCQFCKTYKLDDKCVDNCASETYNNTHLYISDEKNRVCDICHTECDIGCTGPSDFECIKCKNVQIYHNETTDVCLSKCPATHYTDSLTKRCLPCYSDCDGCVGPENVISLNGCKSCPSAIVNNDFNYTIVKCIRDPDCDAGYFPRVIPSSIASHPLANKLVCRKCDSECKTCFGEGSNNCDRNQCVHVYSELRKECASACRDDEYLDEEKKTCLPCDAQCALGCTGGGNYECFKCKSFKITGVNYVRYLANISFNETHDDLDLIKDYVHCVYECPNELPYADERKFCILKREGSYVFGILAGTIILIVALSSVFFLLWYCRIRQQEIRRKKQEEFIDGYNKYDLSNADPINLNIRPDLTKLKLFQQEAFEKLDKLGSGAFGTVFSGLLLSSDGKSELKIAIKELQNAQSDKTKDELLNEAHIMASVNHPYCLRLIGLCMVQPVSLITPLLPKGSVLNYFEKHKEDVTEKMLLAWCMQIAQGMDYLEKREIVHRDLAARNVLVQSSGHVKITDFGLSKLLTLNTQKEGYYADETMRVPVKWLAPECLSNRLFTHKSDVWSFGVTAWELFTFGAKPYDGLPLSELYKQLMNGLRLPQPVMTTLDVYVHLLKCWMEDGDKRPSFEQLALIFQKMSKEPKRYLLISAKCFEEPLINTTNNDNSIESNKTDISCTTELDSSGVRLLQSYTTPGEDEKFCARTKNEATSKSSSCSSDDSSFDKRTKLVKSKFFKQQISVNKLPIEKIKFNKNDLYNRQDSAFFSANADDELDCDSLLNSRNRGSTSSSSSSSDKLVSQSKDNPPKIETFAARQHKNDIMNVLKPSPIYNNDNLNQIDHKKTLQILKQ